MLPGSEEYLGKRKGNEGIRGYGKWAKESAQAGKAYFIDLNEIIAAKYDALGENEVTTKLFLTDHTHTNEAGAIINAQAVTEGIKSLNNCKLKKYLMN